MGRTLNTRLSQAVRGKIVERMRHLASEHGIAVVTVPARNTSKHCPRCLAPLRHCKAPDKTHAPGWKWAACPGCGWQGDRDTGGVAADRRSRPRPPGENHRRPRHRGHVGTRHRRCAGAPGGRHLKDHRAGPVQGRPDPEAALTPRAQATRGTLPVPAPGRDGQRPEGHATTARLLPRAADRDQGATTTSSTPVTRPHRARGAALGAGFHLNAHATPPRWEPIPSTPGLTEDHQAGQRRSPVTHRAGGLSMRTRVLVVGRGDDLPDNGQVGAPARLTGARAFTRTGRWSSPRWRRG